MRLAKVLEGVEVTRQAADPALDITSVVYNSRQAGAGSLFFALPGFKSDGHDYAAAAVKKGAAAVVSERWLPGIEASRVQVRNGRSALAQAAANFYGRPGRKLKVVGVTGTNGKTTTTFLLDSIIRAAGEKPGLIGGVENRTAGGAAKARRTTPEAPELQKMLAGMVEAGFKFAIIEVSSHGIELHRVDCVPFAVSVFTNLTPDHLDLHRTMESYYLTKRRLFAPAAKNREWAGAGETTRPRAAVNTGDGYGQRLFTELGAGQALSFGEAAGAAVRADNLRVSGWDSCFDLVTPAGSVPVSFHLPGRHNIDNALAAAAAAHLLGLPLKATAAGLAPLRSVPGRFEPVEGGAGFKVVVDYAHNEDGLKQALGTARQFTGGKLILVFGCPGERDQGKRPLMGEIAGCHSDLAVLTTDDCYGEKPGQILDATEQGLIRSGGRYLRIADRRAAIEAALEAARPGDLVLVAGKGHEQVQIMDSGPVPFNDAEVVRQIVGKRGRSGGQ